MPIPIETGPTKAKRSAKNVLELTATALMSVAALLLIVVALSGLIRTQPPPPPPPPPPPTAVPTEPIDLTGAILKGNPQARVAMIEYSDFQCPFCGRFARDVAPALWQQYVDSGQVLVAFRHLALEAIHPQALRAAQAAECANRHGQFWTMRDILFRDQAHLDDATLARAARRIAIDGQTFDACMKTIGPERIRSDGIEARKLGISATPAFLIGLTGEDGRVRVAYRIDGAKPLAAFQDALRKVLSQREGQTSTDR